jgi:hypothetical protein
MISVKPAEGYGHIITFDGVVLEIFSRNRDACQRIHIGHLKGIQLDPDGRGNFKLVIRWIGEQLPDFQVDAAQQAKTSELVAAVKQALASFK